MFSVRIVDADFYVAKPVGILDVVYSKFREANVTRVPIIRIFGSTPSGQKTCFHVHQVFPYIFVRYDGTKPCDKYLQQFATSLDFAVQVALGKASSATKHVYMCEIVKRIPFYGYHEGEEEFIKIQFYNPRIVAKVVELLQNGAILNKIFQPYESHIPYLLQFFIDFNLYGMNLVHARKVHFRGWSDSPCQSSSSPVSSCSPNISNLSHANTTLWDENTIPRVFRLGSNIAKTSRCQLEVDVIAEDILNQLEIGTTIGRNPGIAAMWEDEKQRRRDQGQSSMISNPISQDRGEMMQLDLELGFKTKIHEIIVERNQLIQSQLEILEKSLSPEDFQELSQSILLSGKEPPSQTVISQDVDVNIPIVDESVIEDVLQASQSNVTPSGQVDEEMVAILLSLAEDANTPEPQECSPKANTSQIKLPEVEERGSDEENEDEESIIMSQPVWNEDDLVDECESANEDDEDWEQQRIPQFDGPGDDDDSPKKSSAPARSQSGVKTKARGEMTYDDDDDFKMKKKTKASGKNTNRPKREQTTRQRRAGIVQLNILGGNPKKRTHHKSSNGGSVVTTNSKRHPPPSTESNSKTMIWCDGKFPDLETFHLPTKSQRTDNVESSELLMKVNESTLLDSREKIEDALNEDTESCASQSSEFELRLSDSLSDDDDFTSKKKIPRINPQKLESFYITKQANIEVSLRPSEGSCEKSTQSKSGNTELLDKDTEVDIESSSGDRLRVSREIKSNSRNLSEASDPCESSEKDTIKSKKNFHSRKRKRTRSKKSTCLVFSHLGNQNKDKKRNISEVSGNLENTKPVTKTNKAKRRERSRNCKDSINKILRGRILLDACIKLEKISVKELKSRNTHCFTNDDVFPSTEMKEDFQSLKDTVIDDEMDSLYQMAMLSPESVVESVKYESPPLPSSPSFNISSDNQSLSDVNFTGKDERLDVCVNSTLSTDQTVENFPISFISEDHLKTIQSASNRTKCVEEDKLDMEEKSLDPERHNNLDVEEMLVMSTSQVNKTPESLPNHADHFDDVVIKESPEVVSLQDHQVLPEDIGCTVGVLEGACGLQEIPTKSGMDTREHEVGISGDLNVVSPGIDAVCDSFSEDEKDNETPSEKDSFDFDKILKFIESPRPVESQTSSSEIRRSPEKDTSKDMKDVEEEISHGQIKKMILRDIESPSLFEDQASSGEINQSYENSEKSDIMRPLSDFPCLVIPCSNEQEDISNHDAATSQDNSMRQATIDSPNVFENSSEIRIWRPETQPPSPSYVLETRRLYGLPNEIYQKAFCSDPKDLPSTTRVIGGRRLLVSSLSINELSEFDLGGDFKTLREFRSLVGNNMDNSLLKDCLRSLDTHDGNDGTIGIPRELKLALMGDKDMVITPVILPPSPEDVVEWMKNKGTNNQLKSHEPKVLENANEKDEVEEQETSKIKNCLKTSNSVINVSRKTVEIFRTPQLNPALNLRESSQPSNDAQDSQNILRDVLSGPQHSTPAGNLAEKSQTFLECTPIVGEDKKSLRQDLEGNDSEKSYKIKSLRRNILNSQVKEKETQQQASSSEASYIEGPTPTNSFGFKISQPNIQEAKYVRQVQFLTLLSLELHVRTRKSLRPDPEFDAICAIFYHIEDETVDGKRYETGIIVAQNESTKLRSSDSGTSSSTTISECNASSSTQIPHLNTTQKALFEDNLLRTTGISKELNIIVENEEKDAIHRFIKLVHDWDPDILLGFEVQMLSWGYIIQRANALGIDLTPQLSRVQDSSGTARFDAEKDIWGANHTSEIAISGRIVLNIWRLMRHEVTLNVYSFENISYHVLHERIPLYTYRQLSQWWDQKLPHNRWRTVEHYIIRCQNNIKILNHIDLINRTSEFARLYGILFYSVISRGSQFRVESMMLRLVKPMKYLAVSPSIQQRARMDAPECIPLVMEPESRFYSDPVIVLDFQSLYPSMIIAYNYCFSTCLGKVSRLDKIGEFEFGCTSLNVPPALLEKLENDIHVSANGAAFVKPGIRRGILPRMLEEILNTRVMVKKSMKEHKSDKVLRQLLDARQLGLKLIANVTYGYTSANFSGRMPCVEIADAIVRKARETLERAIRLVNSREEWGARVVYGDTDSLFVLVKGATKEEAFRIGMDIVDTVTAENPKPVKLKFEKVYLPCVLQTKKRYVGYMYETLDQKEPVFDAKGIETVRRDTCPAVSKVLEKSLRILFESKDISLVKKFVQRQFCKLMEERVSIQDFIFAKEYRGMRGYKPKACVPALALARRHLSRDRRAEPRVGERVPYVVVNGTPGLPLIQLVRR
ncbi:DNA polymerase zeta catalytic subunit-like isoform X2 [Dendronephthya gigantea]|uniref:DNA polymerase zeta catalytic subunit-like isoform X2 n=1 Tax=Dendronephthya gigantea TaxID=151771 RepID=UPI00106AB069|nr:DNA polymerase zeta catalytic subunit-like isoform X2 [Dendronephthya gigantea]